MEQTSMKQTSTKKQNKKMSTKQANAKRVIENKTNLALNEWLQRPRMSGFNSLVLVETTKQKHVYDL